tara:strand:- start:437 stop:739 length:303 start_codon:yes stop_codon:yes gene_type:complete
LTINQWYAIILSRAEIAHHLTKMTSNRSSGVHLLFPHGVKQSTPINRKKFRQSSISAPVVSVIFAALLSGAAWYCMTSTLDQMTQRDCNAGIQKACDALK